MRYPWPLVMAVIQRENPPVEYVYAEAPCSVLVHDAPPAPGVWTGTIAGDDLANVYCVEL